MRVLRLFVRFGILIALVVGLPILGTTIYTRIHQNPDVIPQASAIVVLSGGGALDDRTIGQTRDRVLQAVAMWEAGHAPIIVMSGAGPSIARSIVPDSRGMRQVAEDKGVPPEVIIEEDKSYSTLLNAWNTGALAEIDRDAPVIVVTNRFHIPRSWFSFRWAGFTDVTMVSYEDQAPEIDKHVYLEGIKWPFNIVRALGARMALAAGIQEARVLTWLE